MSNVVRNQDDKSKLNSGFSNVEVADDLDNSSLQKSRSKNLIERIWEWKEGEKFETMSIGQLS